MPGSKPGILLGLGAILPLLVSASPVDSRPQQRVIPSPISSRTDAAVGTGEVLLSEVMFNPLNPSQGNDTPGEWFEIYNPGSSPINLKGWILTDLANAQSVTLNCTSSTTCKQANTNGDLIINPGQFLVFAQANDLAGATLGVNYGYTADYVYPSGTGSTYFLLANAGDSIVLKKSSGTVVTQLAYNPSSGSWPGSVDGTSIQLTPSLFKEDYVETGKPYWCLSDKLMATTSGGAKANGTPGAANTYCAGVDVDHDGHIPPDDCNDNEASAYTGALEIPDDGVDNDCDGIELFTILQDSGTDSSLGTKNELTDLYVGWDTNNFVFAWDYTLEANANVWYLELGVSGGETNFTSSAGYTGAFPSNFRTNKAMDFMLGTYGKNPLYIYRLTDNVSTDITDSVEALSPSVDDIYRTSYMDDGRAGVGFMRIPWNSFYNLGGGKVPPGVSINIIGIVRAGDNAATSDIAPDNSTQPTTRYISFRVDRNADGTPDVNIFQDTDGDGYVAFEGVFEGDCGEGDASTYPGAPEKCDTIDNNCNGITDEGVTKTYYADSDNDGYGDPDKAIQACSLPGGATSLELATDCDDSDNQINPGAPELCATIYDDNCDGTINDATSEDAILYHRDQDGDTFGDPTTSQAACEAPVGYVEDDRDCNDQDTSVSPIDPEVCATLYDDNCDGKVNESTAVDADLWYADADHDGFGDENNTVPACTQPTGYVSESESVDCDDTDEDVNPAGIELCNTLDDNCDGETDEATAADAPTWYVDIDGDTYGHNDATEVACTAPEGYVGTQTDCDDQNSEVNPGAAEVCNNTDDDCNGQVDGADALDAEQFFGDTDGDNFGDPDSPQLSCQIEEGLSANSNDCDDTLAEVYPGATEVCNTLDDNCDGQVDLDVEDLPVWYLDGDGDGYGVSDVNAEGCEKPEGYAPADAGEDCNDADASVNPGMDEVFANDVDDDCNPATDDDATPTASPTPETPTVGPETDTETPGTATPGTGTPHTGGTDTPPDPSISDSPTSTPGTPTPTPGVETPTPTDVPTATVAPSPTVVPTTDPTESPETETPVLSPTDVAATPTAAATGTPPPGDEDPSGCGCSSSNPAQTPWATLLMGVMGLYLRRRR